MSITTAKMLMGVINTHILNYCEGDAIAEAAECSRQVEDELTKAEARIAELEAQTVTDDMVIVNAETLRRYIHGARHEHQQLGPIYVGTTDWLLLGDELRAALQKGKN